MIAYLGKIFGKITFMALFHQGNQQYSGYFLRFGGSFLGF